MKQCDMGIQIPKTVSSVQVYTLFCKILYCLFVLYSVLYLVLENKHIHWLMCVLAMFVPAISFSQLLVIPPHFIVVVTNQSPSPHCDLPTLSNR